MTDMTQPMQALGKFDLDLVTSLVWDDTAAE